MNLLIATVLFITLPELVYGSTLSLEWPCDSLSRDGYLIEYSPPVGYPPSSTKLAAEQCSVLITETTPATVYKVSVSSVHNDGSTAIISKSHETSSPDAPVLDTVTTTQSKAVISFVPPSGENILYSVDYHPMGNEHEQSVHFKTTKNPIVVNDLKPHTEYALELRSEYRGVQADDAMVVLFRTKGGLDSPDAHENSISNSRGQGGMVNVPVVSAGKSETKRNALEDEYNTEPPQISSKMAFDDPRVTANSMDPPEVNASHAADSSPAYEDNQTDGQSETRTDNGRGNTESSTTHAYSSTSPKQKNEQEATTDSFSEPTGVVRMSMDGEKVKMEWDEPEDLNCGAYLLNGIALDAARSQLFAVGTEKPEATIQKPDHQHSIEVKVFCVIGDTVTREWWAYRVINFGRPNPVRNLRLVDSSTDSSYIAHVQMDYDQADDYTFRNYKIVVSCVPIDRSSVGKEVVVDNGGPILIDKLEPSTDYNITVRNVSRGLEIASEGTELRATTAPVITSVLYPGRLSQTSININFDDSDGNHKFDSYLLTFAGENGNVSTAIRKSDDKSFDVTGLVPGKTYTFMLNTIFKGILSRDVIARIVTYPLKVEKLHPIVGKDYVVLYWEVQNDGGSECRFRISYTGISTSGERSLSTIETLNRNSFRFAQLAGDTYYTFTITGIMGIGNQEVESESVAVTVSISGSRRSLPVLERQGSLELVVTFENDQNTFTDTNGAVDNYAVIVSESQKDADGYDLMSWFDVQNTQPWGPYRTSSSHYNPFQGNNLRSTKFTIGSDDCERPQPGEQYCNGILRANADYFVKIRAYTVSNVAMETDWVAVSNGDEDADREVSTEGRRLPCHFYLNGCPRKASSELKPSRIMLICALVSYLYYACFY